MKASTPIAVVGAGPYGLSLAANLRAQGRSFRIFGHPMTFWNDHLSKGTHMKSDGFASNLHDPDGECTLEAYCKDVGQPYAHMDLPISRENFYNYGVAFQQRCVPNLERINVASVAREKDGFILKLADGSVVHARTVVVAVGISDFAWVPDSLKGLGAELVSHSSTYSDLNAWRGKHVAVLGGGASAADLAALLNEAGARVAMIARGAELRYHRPPTGKRKTWWQQLRNPDSGLGPGWKSFLSCKLPLLFHALPESIRLRAVARHLGPAPGWYMRKRIDGKVPVHLSTELISAQPIDGRLRLELRTPTGIETLVVDHLFAATGFRVDLRRMSILDADLLAEIRCLENTPILDRHFGCSVDGLYFVGAVAANSFGPLLRFTYGAKFAAERIVARLAGQPVQGQESA